MSFSRPAVHSIEITSLAPAAVAAVNNHNQNNGDLLVPPQRVRMRDVQGMPGTTGGLFLRFLQFAMAVASICVMVTTPDFKSVTAFCYLVAAATLQSLWSLVLAVVDIYALLVKRSLRNQPVACLFTIGDGVTGTLTFTAACASAGITVLIGNDFNLCKYNHCAQLETATAMAFLSWFAVSPSFLFNFWTMASQS